MGRVAVGDRYWPQFSIVAWHESSTCSTGMLDPCTRRTAAEGRIVAGQDMKSAPSATRTRDLLLRRQLLYPLSYRGLPNPQLTWTDARLLNSAGAEIA